MRCVSSQGLQKTCQDCYAKTTLGRRGGEGFCNTLVQMGFQSLRQEIKDLEGERNQSFLNIVVVAIC